MSNALKVVSLMSFLFVVAALAAHIVGFVTQHWIVGRRSSSSSNENSEISNVNLGLWRYTVEYTNGTSVTPSGESPLNILPEQCIVLSIAAVNALFCFIVVFKAVHVCVGVLAFIIMTLLLLSALYAYNNTDERLASLETIYDHWPPLKLQWSFYLVFVGLIVNICATAVFLSLVLVRGEKKASKSSKGLGPATPSNDKTQLIATVSDRTHDYEHLQAHQCTTSDDAYATLNYSADAFPNSPNKQEKSTELSSITVTVPRDLPAYCSRGPILGNNKDRPDVSAQVQRGQKDRDIPTVAESIRL